MDNKYLIFSLIIGMLIGYFLSRVCRDGIIKDIELTHPAKWG